MVSMETDSEFLCFESLDRNNFIDFLLSKPNLAFAGLSGIIRIAPYHVIAVQNHESRLRIERDRPNNQLTNEDFEIISRLGKGGFSQVFLVRDKHSGGIFALKKVSKKFSMKWKGELIKREYDIMKSIYHPNIVQLLGSYPDEKFYNFILEYCPGGNLFELIKRYRKLSVETSLYYFCELLIALEYLHKKSIIFRDIKAENIMLDEKGHVKLTDFGLAKVLNSPDELVNSFCGSPIYIAPETLKKEAYTRKVDFYALGILLYEMVTGLPPYLNKDPNMLKNLKLAGHVRFPSGIPPKVKYLIECLLHVVGSFQIRILTKE